MVPRREFCYAGDWSATLNLCTGEMSGCYGQGIKQNIFKNIERPIQFRAVGKTCCSPYCMNSSHFLSLGCIPVLKTPTYMELRNRKDAGWYSEQMKQFLSQRLDEDNAEYSKMQQIFCNICGAKSRCITRVKKVIKTMLNK